MFDVDQFRALIIKPALNDLRLYSDEASELLIFTCAVETQGGKYLKQINGDALGIFQMEPKTYNDIWVNYLTNQLPLRLQLIHNFDCNNIPSEDRLVYDLRYAAAMTRIHYKRIPEALPKLHDLEGLWNYYKTYYNTSSGKANYHDAVNAYQRFRNN